MIPPGWQLYFNQTSLDLPIEELELSIRAYNCLCNATVDRRPARNPDAGDDGIRTVRELCSMTKQELLWLKNFGKVTLAEIEQELARHGLALKDGRP